MRILVVAAHPDDEVLGCGGTIARKALEGQDVYVGILGEGITSRDQGSVETLRACSRKVAKLLGARDLFLYGLPDNRFDTVPLLDVTRIVEELIERLRPQVIYTHHGGDLNMDHVVAHRAVLTAARPVPGQPVKEIYAFEVPSSTEWAFQQFHPPFHPNVFVDVSATLDAKVRAMETYESEVRRFPHPRSPEALRAIARRWGSAVGMEAAEALELIRAIETTARNR
jgi:LmbE family N-acetylglucosaminyl deacetylase